MVGTGGRRPRGEVGTKRGTLVVACFARCGEGVGGGGRGSWLESLVLAFPYFCLLIFIPASSPSALSSSELKERKDVTLILSLRLSDRSPPRQTDKIFHDMLQIVHLQWFQFRSPSLLPPKHARPIMLRIPALEELLHPRLILLLIDLLGLAPLARLKLEHRPDDLCCEVPVESPNPAEDERRKESAIKLL